MERVTKLLQDNSYIVSKNLITQNETGYSGDAIEKLAKYENLYEELRKRQNKIIKEMEELKSLGKNKTVKFNQLLAEKITTNNILSIFEVYGL